MISIEKQNELKNKRLGECKLNKWNKTITIIEYNSVNDIKVKFDDGYVVNCIYQQFEKGNIKHPNEKTIYNIGYIGIGKYSTSINKEKRLDQ